jgi:CMP-N-acetylneuraminic acid synthetase
MNLAGKPLIAWTIDAANNSAYIDKLIVSTDSKKIATIAKQYGADVPFLRPEELASDTVDSVSVLKHAIDFYKGSYDYIMLLQPTSPRRTTDDIDAAIEMLGGGTKSVVSVSKVEHSPLWMNTLPEDLSMKDFIRDEVKNKRSQDLPIYYRLNGAIYISGIEYLYENNGFIGEGTKAFVMQKNRSIDIDDEIDLLLVKFILETYK